MFHETWPNDDTDNIELAGFSVHRQDSAAASGKKRDEGASICQ
jgi:hypothetical protein